MFGKKKEKIIEKEINKIEINKNMTIREAINIKPEIAEILIGEGLGCAGCGLAQIETIEQGALVHGIDPDELIEELNR